MKKFEVIAAILVTAFDVNASAYFYERYRSGDRYFHSEEPAAAAAADTTDNIDDTLRAFVIGQGETRMWHVLQLAKTMKELAQINGVNLTSNIDLEESLQTLYPIALDTLREKRDTDGLPECISLVLSDDEMDDDDE